ncbi:D-alanyl-D-alanine carboxypeptidase family protein [Jiella sp. M17.18]|uniref:D-alanyl-D-alanine carboxypeptidase family protein n=1 Tax=Jiella sp. M17.18 TaxID=3234247 RepID=UPI0034DF78C2
MKTPALFTISTLLAFCLLAAPVAPLSGPAFAKAPKAHASHTSAAPAAAKDPAVVGYPVSSIVVDLDTGKVLSQENATERRYAASTTKLMTAYLALKALRAEEVGLDSPVIMTRRAAAEPPSKMGFEPGSVMRLDMALRMMLVKSANDVAYAIGQMLGGGSMEAFVDKMNAAAADLGMKDTHYVNPNGLPQDGQYQSAKDLAILAIAIRRDFPAFSDYFGTEAISNGRSLIKNGNKLLGRFDGADGMKTGYTCQAGFNLVSSATRNGRTVIAVVMGANGTIERERHSAELIEKGFAADPKTVETKVWDLPTSSGAPLDIGDFICGRKGRSIRANDRIAEHKRKAGEDEGDDTEVFGSPYMHPMDHPPVTVQVSLGGAAGNAIAAPGISLIEAYGIPIPSPRPDPDTATAPPAPTAPTAEVPPTGDHAEADTAAASAVQPVSMTRHAVAEANGFRPGPGPSPEAAKGPRITIEGE